MQHQHPQNLDRNMLLRFLMSYIKDHGVLVGDHVAPKEGGWVQGQPGTSAFVPYTVVFTGPVTITQSTFMPGGYDARMTITTRSFGATREQADSISYLVREALAEKKPDAGGFRTNLLWPTNIGAADRLDDVDPKMWRVVDTFSAECTPYLGKVTPHPTPKQSDHL